MNKEREQEIISEQKDLLKVQYAKDSKEAKAILESLSPERRKFVLDSLKYQIRCQLENQNKKRLAYLRRKYNLEILDKETTERYKRLFGEEKLKDMLKREANENESNENKKS